MTDLLVTGGAGFIGANFVRFWRDHHPSDALVVLDALTYAGNPASLAGVPDIDVVEGDIRNEALVTRLLRERNLDTIVHFAAESHVDRSITGPDAFIETNIIGTHALLKAAR
jgi:dTDP-glucose 4,6-dehydratase